MISKSKLWGNSVALLSANAFLMLASYLMLFGIAYVADVATFGLFVLVLSFLSWIDRIIGDGFTPPLIQAFRRDTPEDLSVVRRVQVAWTLALIFLVFALSPFVAEILGSEELASLLSMAVVHVIPFSIHIYAVAYLLANQSYKACGATAVVFASLRCALVVGIFYFTRSLFWALCGLAIATTLAALFSFFLSKRISRERGEDEAFKSDSRTFHSIVIALLVGIFFSIDMWAVQYYAASKDVVGYYAVAHSIVKVMFAGAFSLMLQMIPAVMRHQNVLLAVRRDAEARFLFRLLMLGLLVCGLGFYFFSETILIFFFGDKYNNSSEFLSILGIANIFVSLAIVLAQLQYYSGGSRLAIGQLLIAVVGFMAIVFSVEQGLGVYAPAYALAAVGLALLFFQVIGIVNFVKNDSSI